MYGMISQTVRYALRILGQLADHPGEWLRAEQIAATTDIPSNYLSKILNQLRKRGIVLSQKGWGGGFMLPKTSSGIPIAEVVDIFDGRKDSRECIFGLPLCQSEAPCPLHEPWERIHDGYMEMLRTVTVQELQQVTKNRAGASSGEPPSHRRRGPKASAKIHKPKKE
jgi:Rrf2 family transcriptional regulator, iron-sulfur cluster assembly transcription factor